MQIPGDPKWHWRLPRLLPSDNQCSYGQKTVSQMTMTTDQKDNDILPGSSKRFPDLDP